MPPSNDTLSSSKPPVPVLWSLTNGLTSNRKNGRCSMNCRSRSVRVGRSAAAMAGDGRGGPRSSGPQDSAVQTLSSNHPSGTVSRRYSPSQSIFCAGSSSSANSPSSDTSMMGGRRNSVQRVTRSTTRHFSMRMAAAVSPRDTCSTRGSPTPGTMVVNLEDSSRK